MSTLRPERTSQGDVVILAEFRRWLDRGAGRPQMDTYFDADAHADTPSMSNRADYIIVDGRIEVTS